MQRLGRGRAGWPRRGILLGNPRVEDEASDVFLGHAWQLVGEDILQPHEPEKHPPVGLGCE